MTPGFGVSFEDLYRRDGLLRLDAAFIDTLSKRDPAIAERLLEARRSPGSSAREQAPLLIALAPHLEAFVAELFGVGDELAELVAADRRLAPLWRVKYRFIKRQVLSSIAPEDLDGFDPESARARLEQALGGRFDELAFAEAILRWQSGAADGDQAAADRLELARRYSAWASLTEDGRLRHGQGVLFRHPRLVDPMQLLEHARGERERGFTVHTIRPEAIRRRDGFGLTDPGPSRESALDEIHYCLLCHPQGTDSCSKGLRAPADSPASAPGHGFRRSALGATLAGCPLEVRISEFHTLRKSGHPVAALAMIVIDNPMVAATGHRICNDCVKACIFQNQTPVDIPKAETRTLNDVLALPWGFEIYSLLTRWNPLNLARPLPAADSGRKVLVAGMGPAGFTLAHHLLNDGHAVVGVDGMKIEPLPGGLCGVDENGKRVAFEPVRDVSTLYEPLDSRITGGFGGVAEYGITVRWDKNFLKLVRLLLQRREAFMLGDGVRFGGTITAADAFGLGFDHVALATGAGRPTTLDIPNGLARGVKTASDFLMALQLTGAAKDDSIANLQLRLPVVVIGGGLTAIDTATEAQAYYIVQVEKYLRRHEALESLGAAGPPRANAEGVASDPAPEWLAHARALREEREAAVREGRPPRLAELVRQWGGVTIAYRRRLVDSPAWAMNHEELQKALEEGVRFAEELSPLRIEIDAAGEVEAVVFASTSAGEVRHDQRVRLDARSVLIAAGTQPNTVPAREDPGHFRLDGSHFQAIDEQGRPVTPQPGHPKPDEAWVLMDGPGDGRRMSFFGDLHPAWSGNVVKAMASARSGHPVLDRVLRQRPPADLHDFDAFSARIRGLLQARVERVERLAPTIVEVVVHAPMAARNFAPGQFFRLQNYESLAPRVELGAGKAPLRLAMEGLAMTGAWADPQKGLVSTIVLEIGASSRLAERLRPGEPVVLMGPTGTPTEIAAGETVVLVGGGLGNAVLFSIGSAFRARGSRVIYFAGYRRLEDRFRVESIEAAADVVVWCCDESPGFRPGRAQDRSFVGSVVDALQAVAEGRLSMPDDTLSLDRVDRLLVIGSDGMMAAVERGRTGPLAPFLNPSMQAFASVNSPMQCMLKEVCGQCLQPHRDPATGRESMVFSCFQQDQPMACVDFAALHQRLGQNAVQEGQTARCVISVL